MHFRRCNSSEFDFEIDGPVLQRKLDTVPVPVLFTLQLLSCVSLFISCIVLVLSCQKIFLGF